MIVLSWAPSTVSPTFWWQAKRHNEWLLSAAGQTHFLGFNRANIGTFTVKFCSTFLDKWNGFFEVHKIKCLWNRFFLRFSSNNLMLLSWYRAWIQQRTHEKVWCLNPSTFAELVVLLLRSISFQRFKLASKHWRLPKLIVGKNPFYSSIPASGAFDKALPIKLKLEPSTHCCAASSCVS